MIALLVVAMLSIIERSAPASGKEIGDHQCDVYIRFKCIKIESCGACQGEGALRWCKVCQEGNMIDSTSVRILVKPINCQYPSQS